MYRENLTPRENPPPYTHTFSDTRSSELSAESENGSLPLDRRREGDRKEGRRLTANSWQTRIWEGLGPVLEYSLVAVGRRLRT